MRVTLPFPHGPYFTILPPRARPHYYLFLTHPSRTQAELGDTAISGKKFLSMHTVEIVVSETKAIPWVADSKPARIFKRRGTYLLEVGDQFETEAKIVEGTCTVEFQP